MTTDIAGINVVVGYLRVSTEEQGESGAGLAAQEDAIRTEVARRGWTLHEMYTDVASGKSRERRSGLDSCLAEVARGSAGTLMVAKVDRLSRSMIDFASIMAEAQAGGWNLVVLDLGVELSTPSGELVATVMAAFAQFERRIIGQRTKDALRALKAGGVRLGRPRTIGEDTLTLIRVLRTSGRSFYGIAALLNEQGIPTGQGGAKWHPSTVRAAFLRTDAPTDAMRAAIVRLEADTIESAAGE